MDPPHDGHDVNDAIIHWAGTELEQYPEQHVTSDAVLCRAVLCYAMHHPAVVTTAQLTALLNTYKAACKRYGITPLKPFITEIEEAIQEVGSIQKVGWG